MLSQILMISSFLLIIMFQEDEWIRVHLERGDLIVIPKGLSHRFTVTPQVIFYNFLQESKKQNNNFVQIQRFFSKKPDSCYSFEADRNPLVVELSENHEMGEYVGVQLQTIVPLSFFARCYLKTGGYSDKSSGRKWTPGTRTVVFSTTKARNMFYCFYFQTAVGALCVAMLVDRGYIMYEDKMIKYWPEFGQNGKENITIDWLMSHRVTITGFYCNITILIRLIYSYHAITYGWIVDQIVRRADPKKRSVGRFFKEEVADKYGIDFHIGLPPSEEHTVSRLSMPSTAHLIKEIVHDPRVLIVLAILHLRPPTSIARKIRENPQWFKLEQVFHNYYCYYYHHIFKITKKGDNISLKINRGTNMFKKAICKVFFQDVNTFNDPELHAMEQVAALGITKAKDLARLFSLMLKGELISKTLVERFKTPQVSSGLDEIVMTPLPKGYGFLYERHPNGGNRWLVGHPGFGGSTVMMDLEEDIVIAYVSNGLKTGMGELTRTYRHLRNAVFECLQKSSTSIK
uniref:Beta-lactamase domain-containing protein n=1 Tax=Heterorhabditis bacteriophora TaxID=37862 RepID=A0A1I7WZG4_HETBA